MKTIFITNIVYKFGDKNVDPYTLPKDMAFIVGSSFNKYVDTAKLIKQNTSFEPLSYFIREDSNVKEYINYEDIEKFISNGKDDEYHSLHGH